MSGASGIRGAGAAAVVAGAAAPFLPYVAGFLAVLLAAWAAAYSRPSVAVVEATLAIERVALVDEEDVDMGTLVGRCRLTLSNPC